MCSANVSCGAKTSFVCCACLCMLTSHADGAITVCDVHSGPRVFRWEGVLPTINTLI
jgi:hypothetical protein